MRKNSSQILALIAVVAMAGNLSACGYLFGTRSAPDEAQLVDGKNLVLPPNYDLRPPRNGGDAEAVLRDEKGVTPSAQQATETKADLAKDQALVNKAGGVGSDIQTTPTSGETAAPAETKRSFTQRWFGWTGLTGE